jgi:hypothetical protein
MKTPSLRKEDEECEIVYKIFLRNRFTKNLRRKIREIP